jgi:hypothetical protein
VVSLTSNPLHIAGSSYSPLPLSDKGLHCGTRTQPWLLEAPAGQRINISLLDFTPNGAVEGVGSGVNGDFLREDSQIHAPAMVRSKSSCVQIYGYILDKSTPASMKKSIPVCSEVGSPRLTSVYLSTNNAVELLLVSFDERIAQNQRPSFLIKVEG